MICRVNGSEVRVAEDRFTQEFYTACIYGTLDKLVLGRVIDEEMKTEPVGDFFGPRRL
jgi:hypothetical protein